MAGQGKTAGDYILLNGQKGNVFNLGDSKKHILGVGLSIAFLGLGQLGFSYLNRKITMVDASIKDPINRPSAPSKQKRILG